MKKRSCRRSQEEKSVHDQATKLRKMTDEQLISHIEAERKSNYDIGYRDGLMKGRDGIEQKASSVSTFLDDIEKLKGIGAVTVLKLRKAAQANGYI